MKTCCRCHRDLDESRFVKSPRYLDGLTQPCKDCRKEKQDARLASNPICIMCGSALHMKGNPYCRTCIRTINDLPAERERPNVDRDNKTMCCRCKVKPRAKGCHYCVDCRSDMHSEWFQKHGKEYINRGDNRKKHNARAFVNWKMKNGEMERKPCEVCGDQETTAHHYMGYDEPYRLVVQHLCRKHHLEADRASREKVDSFLIPS